MYKSEKELKERRQVLKCVSLSGKWDWALAAWRRRRGSRRALRWATFYLARRSEGKNATDRTRYGQTRASPRRFYTHHMQQLSRAVGMYVVRRARGRGARVGAGGAARALAKQITCLKQELRGRAAQAAPAGVGGA